MKIARSQGPQDGPRTKHQVLKDLHFDPPLWNAVGRGGGRGGSYAASRGVCRGRGPLTRNRAGAGCEGGRCGCIEGDGRGRPDVDHLLGCGGAGKLRSEPDDFLRPGDDDDRQLHPHDRFHATRGAHDRHHAAADAARRTATDARHARSAHHAGEPGVAAALPDLGHAVGLPPRRGDEPRDRPIAEDR
jgi:hypothetical protein